MSETQEPAQGLMFADAPVEKLQPLYCIGTLLEIEGVKLSKKGTYIMLPYKLQPLATGIAARGQILFTAPWLTPGFTPADEFDTTTQEGRSALRVYQNNIRQVRAGTGRHQDISALAGLAGTEARYHELAGKLLSITIPVTAPGYSDALDAAFQSVLFPDGAAAKDSEGESIQIGYKMTQNREKDEATGNYVDRPGYQLNGFWYPEDAAIEKLRTDSEDGKFKVGF